MNSMLMGSSGVTLKKEIRIGYDKFIRRDEGVYTNHYSLNLTLDKLSEIEGGGIKITKGVLVSVNKEHFYNKNIPISELALNQPLPVDIYVYASSNILGHGIIVSYNKLQLNGATYFESREYFLQSYCISYEYVIT